MSQRERSAENDALVARLRALAERWQRSDDRTWISNCGDELADELYEATRVTPPEVGRQVRPGLRR